MPGSQVLGPNGRPLIGPNGRRRLWGVTDCECCHATGGCQYCYPGDPPYDPATLRFRVTWSGLQLCGDRSQCVCNSNRTGTTDFPTSGSTVLQPNQPPSGCPVSWRRGGLSAPGLYSANAFCSGPQPFCTWGWTMQLSQNQLTNVWYVDLIARGGATGLCLGHSVFVGGYFDNGNYFPLVPWDRPCRDALTIQNTETGYDGTSNDCWAFCGPVSRGPLQRIAAGGQATLVMLPFG